MSKGNRNRLKRNKGNTFLKVKNEKSKNNWRKKNTRIVKQGSNKGKVIGTARYIWDSEKRNVYAPTKERLQEFLKEVGSKNPFYYQNKKDPHLHRLRLTNGYLWCMWREVMGLSYRTGKNETVPNKLRCVEVFDWFAELEHLITNDEMFWCLITDIWCSKSKVITENPEILYRYGRDKVSLQRRMECADHLKSPSGDLESGVHHTSPTFMKSLLEKQHNVEKYNPDKDEVILYRSYKVEKGKSIRKGVKKINNPDYHIQEEGKGWSYSINKSNSIFINAVMGTFLYKKYLNMNDEDARNHLQQRYKLSNYAMTDPTLNCNYYNCIGTYRVKKKDIVFMTDDWNEMEIVVNPKDAKLIEYQFLNIFDYMTQYFCRALLHTLGVDEDGGGYSTSSILNIDNVYARCKKVCRKLLADVPEYIPEILQEESKRVSDVSSFGTELLAKVKGNKELWMDVLTDTNSTTRHKDGKVQKYVMLLADANNENADYFQYA